ncbi:MAG TPA: TonB family protein [Candidatus Aquilonibacter sp.]|nr:TonB family protein [Candidatus Aquilonibacter sp.]
MPGAFEYLEEHAAFIERRTHARQSTRTLSYVELDEGNGGIVLNASEGGLSVQAVMSLMEDALPKMRFQLSESNDWLETSARVVWANRTRKVAGLQFVDLPEEIRTQIRDWVARGGTAAPAGARPVAEPRADRGDKLIGAEASTEPSVIASEPASDPNTSSVFARKQLEGPGHIGGARASDDALSVATREARLPDRSWNLAAVVAGLAILSLVAGWIAGRGTFHEIWSQIRPAHTADAAPDAAAAPLIADVKLISEIEIVDVRDQRWTIPFNPISASGDNASGRRAPRWPSFDPDAATPKIRAPLSGTDKDSQQTNPPEIVGPAGSAASLPISSQPANLAEPKPPADANEPSPARAASGLQRGALIYHVDPVYPEIARNEEVQGTVKLGVTIDETGAVREVVAVSGPTPLVEAARNAVRRWRYTPSLLDGKPVETQEQVSVVFQLSSTSK